MSSQVVLHTAQLVRLTLISRVEEISEDLFDVQPSPFNNTIRWNIGHIIATLDRIVFNRVFQTSMLPAGFSDYYKNGTKPSDWANIPHSKDELLGLLKQQFSDLTEKCTDKLDEPLPEPVQIRVHTFSTVAELIGYAFVHETVHSTTIANYNKLVSVQ
ncbi:DinB family protein [Paenibacillus sp. GP183]|uniref:DinB family protein n=1 Tax=Paenibacillus sp. GP183 TaxID=1882751 RepID=UPI000898527B|nr:DinB family protein [Paenibacillus sp. GP183]SEB43088.1 Uncharacterized damage-inducible protein DinB (forms a four-helix bundle) [Paenibacillus sp. GP183]